MVLITFYRQKTISLLCLSITLCQIIYKLKCITFFPIDIVHQVLAVVL